MQTFKNDYIRLITDLHSRPGLLYYMIILEPLVHKESLCIAVRGKYNGRVASFIRAHKGLVFSSTHRCYYVKYSAEALETLRRAFLGLDDCMADGWSQVNKPEYFRSEIKVPDDYRDHLIKRRYSKATRQNYEAQFKAFLAFIHPKTADEICDDDIHNYQLYLISNRGVSHSTQNQAINAIKFYLEQVKKGERKEYYIERPRREFKLPTVLSEEEVRNLLERTHYIKHKCILILLYSAGLRMSELLKLRPTDLDRDRRLIYVRAAKGKKDRVTILSAVAMNFIQDYIDHIKPKVWLFEGPV